MLGNSHIIKQCNCELRKSLLEEIFTNRNLNFSIEINKNNHTEINLFQLKEEEMQDILFNIIDILYGNEIQGEHYFSYEEIEYPAIANHLIPLVCEYENITDQKQLEKKE